MCQNIAKVRLFCFVTSHQLARKKTSHNELTGWSGRTFHLIWSDKRLLYRRILNKSVYLIMQHLCESASSQLFLPQHSLCTSCVSLSILAFLQIHPPEWRTDHYLCLLGVCMEYHSQFLLQNIQILTTVSCFRFIHGRHWQLRRLFLFIWQFDPCVCHFVLPPQEAQCMGNGEIKEQSTIEYRVTCAHWGWIWNDPVHWRFLNLLIISLIKIPQNGAAVFVFWRSHVP